MKKEKTYGWILRKKKLKDLTGMLDYICTANYFDGKFGNKIRVEENREAFEHIINLINKED